MEAEAEATHSSLVPQKHNDLFIVRGHMTYRNPMTTGNRIDGRNAHRIDIVRDVLTTQHVDRMHGQGDVSIPTAIVSYGFRNLFRNEKRYEDDFPLRRARAMAV